LESGLEGFALALFFFSPEGAELAASDVGAGFEADARACAPQIRRTEKSVVKTR
jgi:hypothetical protein